MKTCATICTVLVLAFTMGTTFHGPIGAPDDGGGNFKFAHGPIGAPDDGGGNIQLAHGPIGAPDDGGGNRV